MPAISSRFAETEIELKDGESFAIAGLIDNRVTQILSKVPGLGNIPILGKLFQSRSSQKSTDELLVVITPRFVKALEPGDQAKLPVTALPFLPPVPEQQAKGKGKDGKKNNSANKKDAQPEFVGPHGYQVPN